jgi:hypothetical protein
MKRILGLLFLSASVLAASCGGAPEAGDADLPLGDRLPEDAKSDGTWGYALECKPIPDYPRLSSPEITISLHGLSLRLVDRATGFEKVFPVGVGAIDTRPTESTFGESLSYYPVLATGKNTFSLQTRNIQPCKTWWTDPETGVRQPVFAGLPFMPFYGGYAIHGPIDNFRAANGGNLRRGFVSHGCIRMESADVLEVYSRIRGVSSVPVRLQREPERDAAGRRIDAPRRWIGAECASDADCDFPGGLCKRNRVGGRGFCTARCSRYCPDRAGAPPTFCIADPDAPALGMCVPRTASMMPDCRPLDHFTPASLPRFGQPTVKATVCVPGSPGWIGDRCLSDADCKNGTRCAAGLCTQSCARYCPDQPGLAPTFCVGEPAMGSGGSCARTCTPALNAPECPAGTTCRVRSRFGDPATTKHVCLP